MDRRSAVDVPPDPRRSGELRRAAPAPARADRRCPSRTPPPHRRAVPAGRAARAGAQLARHPPSAGRRRRAVHAPDRPAVGRGRRRRHLAHRPARGAAGRARSSTGSASCASGGELSLYLRTAARMLRTRGRRRRRRRLPERHPVLLAAVRPAGGAGRAGDPPRAPGPVRHPLRPARSRRWAGSSRAAATRRVYGTGPIAAVSPVDPPGAAAGACGFRGPIHVVPNGTIARARPAGPRDPDPTIAVVTRLVPHKRVDLLLGSSRPVAARGPAAAGGHRRRRSGARPPAARWSPTWACTTSVTLPRLPARRGPRRAC